MEKELKEHNALMGEDFWNIISREDFWSREPDPFFFPRAEEEKKREAAKRREIMEKELNEAHHALMRAEEKKREAAPAMDPEIMEIQTERERADSPEPSCVSLRSGRSMDYPTAFNQQDFIPKQRAGSPAPSCVSLKSDCSRDSPLNFSDKPGPPDRKDPGIDAGLWTEVNSIFSLLRENIVDYVDNELNTFRRFLTNDPEGLESQGEYEEGLNAKEEVQRRGSREGLLKITLDFLRRMNQEELADSLQDKALAADGHRKPKSKLSHAIGCMFARAMRSVPMFK